MVQAREALARAEAQARHLATGRPRPATRPACASPTIPRSRPCTPPTTTPPSASFGEPLPRRHAERVASRRPRVSCCWIPSQASPSPTASARRRRRRTPRRPGRVRAAPGSRGKAKAGHPMTPGLQWCSGEDGSRTQVALRSTRPSRRASANRRQSILIPLERSLDQCLVPKDLVDRLPAQPVNDSAGLPATHPREDSAEGISGAGGDAFTLAGAGGPACVQCPSRASGTTATPSGRR